MQSWEFYTKSKFEFTVMQSLEFYTKAKSPFLQ